MADVPIEQNAPIDRRARVARVVLWIMFGFLAVGGIIIATFLLNPAVNQRLQAEIAAHAERAEMRQRIDFLRPECPATRAVVTGEDRGCALLLALADNRVAQVTRIQIVDESSVIVYGILSPFGGVEQISSSLFRPTADYLRTPRLHAGRTSIDQQALLERWLTQIPPESESAEAPPS